GALCFEGFAELGAAIDLLLDEPGLTRRLGDAGWRYVCENYAWDAVLGRYARLLESVADSYGRRRAA
ncbi:MAG: glycosyltransferase, partial [Acidimicrobiales bacterium]